MGASACGSSRAGMARCVQYWNLPISPRRHWETFDSPRATPRTQACFPKYRPPGRAAFEVHRPQAIPRNRRARKRSAQPERTVEKLGRDARWSPPPVLPHRRGYWPASTCA